MIREDHRQLPFLAVRSVFGRPPSFPRRIEHLPIKEVDEELAAAVLGLIRPRVAVMTTPNFEFNVLFPDFKQGVRKFRHPDHKFEWTRAEFEAW